MKTIKKIFLDDIIGLAKNFFALVIVIGICFLPALYAWFNIYSNWDPYGSTGELKLAAVSLDKGYTDDEGKYHNQGDTIIENLHENTAVNWQFVETEDAAIEGVNSGEYYAAVVIDENFTHDMYNVFSEDIESPSLIFYENQKKNPVATKISDTVVQTLQTNINSAFIEVVMTEVFSGAGDFYNDLQEDGGIDGVVEKLKVLNADLTAYHTTIDNVIAADEGLKKALEAAKSDSTYLQNQANTSASAIDGTKAQVAATDVTLTSYSQHMNDTLTTIQTTMTSLQNKLNSATLSNDAKEIENILKDCSKDAANLKTLTNALEDAISNTNIDPASDKQKRIDDINNDPNLTDEEKEAAIKEINKAYDDASIIKQKSEDAVSGLGDQASSINSIITILNASGTPVGDAIAKGETGTSATIGQAKKQVADMQQNFNSQVIPQVNQSLANLETTLGNTSTMLTQMGQTFGNMNVMFSSLQSTLTSANTSLTKTNEALAYVNDRIAQTIEKVEEVDADEKVATLIETLSGDPKTYGAFFSSPVNVTTEAVYPIANYGSAVAPFYSTLAFWVGALILTAIIKVHPNKEKYPAATPTQMFFGRYVLYWVLGQIQALIIVIGDIYLLKIQCLNKGWFFLAASIIATTFTIFIYSLVVTWGDAGKALAVVIVVIQIAGSSGTYPIELLPEFFKKVYIFFPFPYAINAIRECLCGMYEMDYLVYLLQLCIFIIVALVIGLLVRVPFEELNHYMEERMEETEMM